MELLWSRAVRTPPLEDFVLAIRHRRVEDLGRRAKFLLFGLDGGGALVIHLRMTGSLLVEPADTPRPAMTRNVFIMTMVASYVSSIPGSWARSGWWTTRALCSNTWARSL